MFIYGKTASNAISLMSYLAALPNGHIAGSHEMSKARGITKALAAKILTRLALAGLVRGQPGPGGGYCLGHPANSVSILDIATLFAKIDPPSLCPFGPNWCGNKAPCPLHDKIAGMITANRQFMKNTRLSLFAKKNKASRTPSKRRV
ncbi:MAG: Rrf2 family transcriptional regulator [Verrucomicrobia bacterium]|nr:Rrf2 family transcriptional regulator [Verrucomicrobiota bacterium]